jgi:hypothetical protein
MVIVCEEELGGAETHEMGNLGPHTSSVASSLRFVNTAQDINEAQSVISQVEGVTSIWPCGLAVSSRDDYFVLLQDPGEATSLRWTLSTSPAAAMMSESGVLPTID